MSDWGIGKGIEGLFGVLRVAAMVLLGVVCFAVALVILSLGAGIAFFVLPSFLLQ